MQEMKSRARAPICWTLVLCLEIYISISPSTSLVGFFGWFPQLIFQTHVLHASLPLSKYLMRDHLIFVLTCMYRQHSMSTSHLQSLRSSAFSFQLQDPLQVPRQVQSSPSSSSDSPAHTASPPTPNPTPNRHSPLLLPRRSPLGRHGFSCWHFLSSSCRGLRSELGPPPPPRLPFWQCDFRGR
jgi:hypothetical protein